MSELTHKVREQADALLDHIYECGTASEGVTCRINAVCDKAVEPFRTEIFCLTAQLAESEAQARRYRWLRDTGDASGRPFALREGDSAGAAGDAMDAALRGEVKP